MGQTKMGKSRKTIMEIAFREARVRKLFKHSKERMLRDARAGKWGNAGKRIAQGQDERYRDE